MSWKLKDPFTAANTLVTLAGLVADTAARRETLRSAEELAKGVRPGDRDYALRWIVSGYRTAGLADDERRVRGLMSQDVDVMNESEAQLMNRVEALLRPFAPPAADSQALRLRRFLDYGYNDLRVLFLIECARSGGLNDVDAEQLVQDEAFRRIAPARPPSIYSDPSHFDVESLAASFFGRPVCQHDSDRELIGGTGDLDITDVGRFLDTLRHLFARFGDVASRFSPEQVEQGLWYLFGHPFWLTSRLPAEELSSPRMSEFIRAMYAPFRDYYLPTADRYSGSAFFMWWDLCGSLGQNPAAADTAVDVLRQILTLPHQACRDAALHGLNHFFPHPQAAAIIDSYLDKNRNAMSKEEIEWAELCRVGRAQ